MLTSKGMAGVPGSGFLALSATASCLGVIPAGAVALLRGVDRIMGWMRVATNLLGDCVVVFAMSRWKGALDTEQAKKVLDGEIAFVQDEGEGEGEDGPVAGAEVPARPEPAAADAARDTRLDAPVQTAKEPAPEVG